MASATRMTPAIPNRSPAAQVQRTLHGHSDAPAGHLGGVVVAVAPEAPHRYEEVSRPGPARIVDNARDLGLGTPLHHRPRHLLRQLRQLQNQSRA